MALPISAEKHEHLIASVRYHSRVHSRRRLHVPNAIRASRRFPDRMTTFRCNLTVAVGTLFSNVAAAKQHDLVDARDRRLVIRRAPEVGSARPQIGPVRQA